MFVLEVFVARRWCRMRGSRELEEQLSKAGSQEHPKDTSERRRSLRLVCSKVGDGKRVWMYVCVHANVCLRFCSGLCTRVHRHGHITAAHIYIYVCVSSTICI